MSKDSAGQMSGLSPNRLDVNWYPNETFAAFLLLAFVLVGGCFSGPFAPFLLLAHLYLGAIGNSISTEPYSTPIWLLAGLASIASLIMLTCVFLYRDLKRLQASITGSPLEEADKAFHSAIQSRCLRTPGVSVQFFMTTNPLDTNAFTFGMMRNFIVVLGGGLRILFRRNPESALVRVEHEVGHIRNHDVAITLVARALIRAYLILVFVSILVSVVKFQVEWLLYLPTYWKSGNLFSIGLQANIIPLATNIVQPSLLIAAISWMLYRRIVQIREYYADARVGDRRAIEAVLQSATVLEKRSLPVRLKCLFSLHPTISMRLRRVAYILSWARYDLSYMFVLGLLGSLGLSGNVDVVDNIKELRGLELENPKNLESFLQTFTSGLTFLTFGGIYFFAALLTWGSVAHISRVSTIQALLGWAFTKRIAYCIPVTIVVTLGFGFGIELWPFLTAPNTTLSGQYEPLSWSVLIFLSVISFLFPIMGIASIGAWLLVRWPTHRAPILVMMIVAIGSYHIAASGFAFLCHLSDFCSKTLGDLGTVFGILNEFIRNMPVLNQFMIFTISIVFFNAIIAAMYWRARSRSRALAN